MYYQKERQTFRKQFVYCLWVSLFCFVWFVFFETLLRLFCLLFVLCHPPPFPSHSCHHRQIFTQRGLLWPSGCFVYRLFFVPINRYSRKEGYFDALPKDKGYPKKLCFKFGPKSHGWKEREFWTHNACSARKMIRTARRRLLNWQCQVTVLHSRVGITDCVFTMDTSCFIAA